MKSSKQFNKQSVSPLIPKNIELSDRKKRSVTRFPANPYHHTKQFQTHAKNDKKRSSNYLKDLIKQTDSANKYRIVTEPVDDRVMTIISSSFAPYRSKGKLQTEHSRQKNRLVSQQRKGAQSVCLNCKKYIQQLNCVRNELNRMLMSKVLWKNGQLSLSNLKDQYGLCNQKQTHTKSISNIKSIQKILDESKKHFYDLMKDIESLTQIDYPKMLSLKIFKYDSSISTTPSTEQTEIKSLIAKMRNHYEGKINSWDLEDETEQSDHVKAVLRNLKSRLSHYLRQNLQLKTKKAILQKAEEISGESEDYLRHIVEEVISTYTAKL